jgi:hypothetical protein
VVCHPGKIISYFYEIYFAEIKSEAEAKAMVKYGIIWIL